MENLIQYLTDMLANDKQVVSIAFVLEQLKDIREDMRQTRYDPHTEVFKHQQDKYTIEAGWRAAEASRSLRIYE